MVDNWALAGKACMDSDCTAGSYKVADSAASADMEVRAGKEVQADTDAPGGRVVQAGTVVSEA